MSGQHFLVGVQCIVHHDDGIIMLGRRSTEPGYQEWALPGGHIEPGETVYDAARRELLEKTGFVGEKTAVLPPIIDYDHPIPYVHIPVCMRIPNMPDTMYPPESGGLDALRWWHLHRVRPARLFSSSRMVLEAYNYTWVPVKEEGTDG
jgi:ADP-ribose pyrophosphatase YjhB (NUDIX family)